MGICDGSWLINWERGIFRHCEIRTLQMRGNGMEVGDIGAVFRRAWLSRYTADSYDCSAKKR